MGWNTTVIVLNDALGEIENDPEFGKKLAVAIGEQNTLRKRVDVCAGNHVNAASVIEQHHANDTVIVAIGGNYGSVIETIPSCDSHHTREDKKYILEYLSMMFKCEK